MVIQDRQLQSLLLSVIHLLRTCKALHDQVLLSASDILPKVGLRPVTLSINPYFLPT